MADDVIGSPAWWRDQLYTRLNARLATIDRLERYYDGEHELKFVSEKYKRAFAKMLRELSDNWMPLVVDAVNERLHIEGFRVSSEEPKADKAAWEIWQRNHLDADSKLLHRTSLTCGTAYAMVWYGANDKAEISIEHPAEVIVAYQPGSRRLRRAGFKCWHDEWSSTLFANVYLPDGIYKFKSPSKGDISTRSTPPTWVVRANEDGANADGFVKSPLGVVPIVEFRNRPSLRSRAACGMDGRSEFAEVISTQDQINKLVCDMLIAAEFAAFRQRWATGLELEKDPDTGEDLEPFKSEIARLFISKDKDTQFGQFEATDLGNYVKGLENRLQSLASRTRTPPHYLLGQSGSFPSGESLKSTETGLVAKAEEHQVDLGESHEEVMGLSGRIEGHTELANAVAMETVWRDPESRTEAEHVDALVKLRTIGVPYQALWERIDGVTPQEIERWRGMLLDEALNQLIASATAPPANEPTPPTPVPA